MKNSGKLTASIDDLDTIPYKSIHVYSRLNQNQKLLSRAIDSFKEHAYHIEAVAFFRPSMNTFTKTMDALICDKITFLSIWPGNEEQLDDNMAMNFPNLKILDIYNGSRILSMINSHKLESLSISITSDYTVSVRDINRFLQTCPDLKDLSFVNFVPVLETANMNFQLKRISIEDLLSSAKILSRQQMDCLKALIEMSCDTLAVFYVHNYVGIGEIFQFMLPKVKNLKYLTFWSLSSTEIEDDFPINRGITKLSGAFDHDFHKNCSMMKKLIHACPSTTILDLKFCFDNVTPLIHEAAVKLPDLKELSIWIPNGLFTDQYPSFQNLETLRIWKVTCQKDIKPLMNLLLAAPKLKSLKIYEWNGNRIPYLTKMNLKKVLTACKELEEIYIGGQFILPKSFVDGLLKTESNIRNLTIETSRVDLIRENGRKLLNSKIRCTALQFQPMESDDDNSSDESTEDESSDMDDSEVFHVSFDSDNELYFGDDEMMDLSGDQFDEIQDEIEIIPGHDQDVARIEPEDVELIENPDDLNNSELILDQDGRNDEIDRFDEIGRRRSKRLRRN